MSDAGCGVPAIFPIIHNKLVQSSKDKSKDNYIPFIDYSSMPVVELDHDHPIWLMKQKHTALISDYLLSQQQLERSIKNQYEGPFFDLAHSDAHSKREQWLLEGYIILEELAEHYVTTQKLKEFLVSKHNASFE